MTAPSLHPSRFTAFSLPGHVRRRLAMVVLAALLLSTVLAIADGPFVAWNAGHGHIYRNGIPVSHTHPWDADGPSAPRACAAAASEDVVFTPSADALAGVSIAGPLLPGQGHALCTSALTVRPLSTAVAPVAQAAFAAVPTPPPRG